MHYMHIFQPGSNQVKINENYTRALYCTHKMLEKKVVDDRSKCLIDFIKICLLLSHICCGFNV
uniref:Uncharacterized protein n=1 Tax=Anguilla anguilla TaxID=7936 RepID=A0A0E9XAC5_ANGAN